MIVEFQRMEIELFLGCLIIAQLIFKLQASSFVSIGKQDTDNRQNAREKQHLNVLRPQAVKIFNGFMGGVDKLDYLISLFQVHAKTKKCPVGVSFNFLAFSLANALIEY